MVAAVLLFAAGISAALHTTYIGLTTGVYRGLANGEGEADVWGQVVDADTGEPLANVTVVAQETGVENRTGPEGLFSIRGLSRGEQRLRLERDGYRNITWTFLNLADMERPAVGGDDGGGGDADRSGTGDGADHIRIEMEPGPGDDMEGGEDFDLTFSTRVYYGCTVMMVTLTVLVFVAGYHALRMKRYAVSLGGSFAGILVLSAGIVTLFAVLSMILSLVALVLIVFGREVFESAGGVGVR